jgi:hypothetical protein
MLMWFVLTTVAVEKQWVLPIPVCVYERAQLGEGMRVRACGWGVDAEARACGCVCVVVLIQYAVSVAP